MLGLDKGLFKVKFPIISPATGLCLGLETALSLKFLCAPEDCD